MNDASNKTEQQWRETLTPAQYRVMREGGTERPFANRYWNTKTAGTYRCAGCGQTLFASETKYDSGSGWPSFFQPVTEEHLALREDHSHGMVRTEVSCARCNAHLGHRFPDGPPPTGQRYCINSAALDLEPRAGESGKTDG